MVILVLKEKLSSTFTGMQMTGNLLNCVVHTFQQDMINSTLNAAIVRFAKMSLTSPFRAIISTLLRDLELFRYAIEVGHSRRVQGSADEVMDGLVKHLNKIVRQRCPDWLHR